MKITLFMAQTPNGIIARENGSEDFLSNENWNTFKGLAEKAGCFIIGRKTYEAVQKWEDYNYDDVKAKRIVISQDKDFKIKKGFILVNSTKAAIEKAKSLGFKNIILTGGSTTNSIFIKQKLVDEIILNIEPFIIGKGIKTIAEDNFEFKIKLDKVTKLKSGIVQLKYTLNK